MFQNLKKRMGLPRSMNGNQRPTKGLGGPSKALRSNIVSKSGEKGGALLENDTPRLLRSAERKCSESTAHSAESTPSPPPQQFMPFLNLISKSREEQNVEIDCTTPIPASRITARIVKKVAHSWETGMKSHPNWLTEAGEIFLRRIFQLDPSTIQLFGFTPSLRWDDPALSHDKRFQIKAGRIIKAIDMAVGFLGPNVQPLLEEELYSLGGRHAAMGIRPCQWPMVGEALIYTFEKFMAPEDVPVGDVKNAWILLYNFLGYHMIQGLLAKAPEAADTAEQVAAYRQMVKDNKGDKKETVETPSPVVERSIRRSSYPNLDCTTRIEASSIDYSVVFVVAKSWTSLKRENTDWIVDAGETFLRKILKHGGVETFHIFGYPVGTSFDDPMLSRENKKFLKQATKLIRAIDMAVEILGPDLEALESKLFALGERHVALGCKPSHWSIVGRALFDVFDKFGTSSRSSGLTPEARRAWAMIYNFLGFHMIKGLVHKEPSLVGK